MPCGSFLWSFAFEVTGGGLYFFGCCFQPFHLLQKPLHGSTPRLVYKWFYFLHQISCGLGIIGYSIIMATFMGVNMIFGVLPTKWMDCGVLLLFYGLYYGVLGRDLAEIAADSMAANVGVS